MFRLTLVVFLVTLCFSPFRVSSGDLLEPSAYKIYPDTANQSFEEILKIEQTNLSMFGSKIDLDPSISVYWLKIEASAIHGQDYLLLSNYFDRIEAYYKEDTTEHYAQSGRLLNLSEKDYPNGFYRNVIPIDPQGSDLFLKLISEHGYSRFNRSLSHLELVRSTELEARRNRLQRSSILFSGMELIILLINVALIFLRPNYTSVFYSLMIVFSAMLANLQNQIFMDLFGWSAHTMHVLEQLVNLSLIASFNAFSVYYLEAKKHSKWIFSALMAPVYLVILAVALTGDGFYFPVMATIYFVSSVILLIILVVRSYRKGYKRTILYAVANGFPVGTGVLIVLSLSGIIPHFFLSTSLMFGSFVIRDTLFTIEIVRNYFSLQEHSIRSRVTLEKLQAEKEQLLKVEELKSRFFNNASHELRTPLTLILSPLEKVMRNENVSQEIQKQLDLSLRNGRYLHQLVEEMLDFSKLEGGEVALHRERLNVMEVIAALVEILSPLSEEDGLTISIQGDQSIKASVDREKFEKIIVNLLSNAIKFSDKSGKIIVKIEAVNKELFLEITDQGIGIQPEDTERIFDRNYRSIPQESIYGNGIGLSIVKQFVELHGGSIHCTSEVGVGSKFSLNFRDCVVLQHFQSPVQNELKYDPAKKTIMLVEDHLDLLEYLKDQLNEDYNVIGVTNGVEALSRLESGTAADLVITDYSMPKMDGATLARNLKSHDEWSQIPIIFLTARTMAEDRNKVYEIGVDDYIIKPFDTDELLIRIRHALKISVGKKEFSSSQIPEISRKSINPFKTDLDSFILKNIKNPNLSNIELASHFNLSERNLYRKIKAVTGQSPAAYIREIRLHNARLILESDPELGIAEVAYQCGINNLPYFSQLFKRRFGKAPSSSRKTIIL